LRYQAMSPASGPKSEELLFVKLRYKDPEGEKSRLIEAPVRDSERNFQGASADFRFAAAVAAFGMTLRDSPHRGSADFTLAYTLAEKAIGADVGGYRAEFLQLVKRAQALKLLKESE
jgi:Ca-activated chloride channel homolog